MEALRKELVAYIRRKFTNIDGIYAFAEDIVQEAWLLAAKTQTYNFGYLSKVCVRLAYRLYKRQRQDYDTIDLLVSEDDVAAQIMEHERADAVLASLDTLRAVERAIVVMRYYEDCSFAEIGRRTGVNLNTVLTTHRRALEKLRPRLSRVLSFEPEPAGRDYLRDTRETAQLKRFERMEKHND